MPDEDFYNSIGAFRVASEPRGYHTRRLMAKHAKPPPKDKDCNIVLGDLVFRKDSTYGLVEETTFKFNDDGTFELRDDKEETHDDTK